LYTHRYGVPMSTETSDPFTFLGIPHAHPAILARTGKVPPVVTQGKGEHLVAVPRGFCSCRFLLALATSRP